MLFIIHGLAAIASLVNTLFWIYKVMALAVVGCSLYLSIRRYYSQFQPYRIRHTDNLLWQLATSANDFQAIQILPSTVITTWLIVLHFHFEPHGKRHSLIIFNDALPDKDYRALAVTLKIAGYNPVSL